MEIIKEGKANVWEEFREKMQKDSAGNVKMLHSTLNEFRKERSIHEKY